MTYEYRYFIHDTDLAPDEEELTRGQILEEVLDALEDGKTLVVKP